MIFVPATQNEKWPSYGGSPGDPIPGHFWGQTPEIGTSWENFLLSDLAQIWHVGSLGQMKKSSFPLFAKKSKMAELWPKMSKINVPKWPRMVGLS